MAAIKQTRRGGFSPSPGQDPSGESNGSGSPIDTSFEALMAMNQDAGVASSEARARVAETHDRVIARVEVLDKTQENIRGQILAADLSSVKANAADDEKSIGKAMAALDQVARDLDERFENLNEPIAEEKVIVERAIAQVTAKQAEIDRLKVAGWWARTLGGAKEKLAAAETEIQDLNIKVQEAHARVASLVETRLQNANLEANLKSFEGMSNKTAGLMIETEKMLEGKRKIVDAEYKETLRNKEAAAKGHEKIGRELADIELTLKSKEEEITSLQNGTEEHAKLDTEIANLRVAVKDKRVAKDQALAAFQAQERACENQAIALMALIEQKGTLRARYTKLMLDTKSRVKVYDARLATMKALANHRYDEQLAAVGKKLDHNTAVFLAKSIVAASNSLMEEFESQPEVMAELKKVRGSIAEHQQSIREREARVEENMRKNNGLDPRADSFYAYEAGKGGSGEATGES